MKLEERLADILMENFRLRTESSRGKMCVVSICPAPVPLFLCSSFLLQSNRPTVFLDQSDSFSGFCLPCCHRASLPFTCPAFPSSQDRAAGGRREVDLLCVLCSVLGQASWYVRQGLGASAEGIKQHRNSVVLRTQIKAHYFLSVSTNFSVLYKYLRSCCQKNKSIHKAKYEDPPFHYYPSINAIYVHVCP